MREIILALMFWISAQAGYEVNIDPPRLVFLSPAQVVDICIDEGTLIPYAAEACYKLHKHAVYLRNDFNIYRADQLSTLVHELTHVLQLSNGRDYNLQTMDTLESEANRMEALYKASPGIQRKVRNLISSSTAVAGLSRSPGIPVSEPRNQPESLPQKTLFAGRQNAVNRDNGYDARYFDQKYPRVRRPEPTAVWEHDEPVLPLPPKTKTRSANQSLLKQEILTRMGRYGSPRPEPIQNRIYNKIQRNTANVPSQARPSRERPSRYYVLVLPGDTVSGLARIYGVSPTAIRRLNGLRGETLSPGQRIRIP